MSPTANEANPTEAEASPEASAPTQTEARPKPRNLPEGRHYWWGTGRRKSAVARVRVRPGEGIFKVNDRDLDDYFHEMRDRDDIRNVLEKTNTVGRIDVYVKTHGGGFMGQAGAIVLGLGRALLEYDPSLESILRDQGFLTRDAREVERKKYGQAGARRRFQFSKR